MQKNVTLPSEHLIDFDDSSKIYADGIWQSDVFNIFLDSIVTT